MVILDCNWRSEAREEDKDAPRRLYYVAMTRARLTLSLIKASSSNPFLKVLQGHPSVLTRQESEHLPPIPQGARRSYHRLSLRDVQLSFAGYRPAGHPIHAAIASLSSGDLLKVRTDRTPWELTTIEGTTVGRLAQGFKTPPEVGGVSATVLAIARWNKVKSELKFLDRLKADDWEVVIPEIVTEKHP